MNKVIFLGLGSVVVFVLLGSFPADNLAFAAQAATESIEIEEVVVTARGRSENLLDIPDTVTTFSGSQIEQLGIESMEDVVAHTPGVFLINDQDPGTNIVTIRGVTTNRLQQASIAYVVDGVTLADTEFFTTDYFDIERVEVLKGPQGALYGKNAIGGVFNIITKEPQNEFGAKIEAGYGDADSYKVAGSVTGPIVEDKVLFRLSGSVRETDGRITNTTAQRKVDYYASRNLRGRLLMYPANNLSVDARINYMNEGGGAAWISSNEITNTFAGRLSGDALIEPVGDFVGSSNRWWLNASLKLDYELANGGVLTSISAYDDYDKWWQEDLDFLPIALFQPVLQPVQLEVFTQEIRYTSADDNGERFRWIVGAFYQDTERNRVDDIRPLGIYNRSDVDSEQWAVFGQFSFDLTEKLELTGALRYDRDSRKEDLTNLFTSALFDTTEEDYSELQPKVSLSYRIDDENMVYATYAQGFKSGGFNPDPSAVAGADWVKAFDSESTKTVEIGSKSKWFDNRFSLSLAAYYIDYEDKQEFTFTPAAQVTFNIPKVEIVGVEVSAIARPVPELTLNLGYAYTDSEIKEFQVVDFRGPQDWAGRQTPSNPKQSLNLGAQYTYTFKNGSELTGRIDLQHIGRTYFEVDNILFAPSRESLDARLTYQHNDRWSISIWGKNITDERWAISAFGQQQLLLLTALGTDIFTINPGSQYGVTLKAEF